MSTSDRYLLGQILRPLTAALLIALAVLLIERMLRLLDLMLGSHGPLGVVFEILAYLVPHYLTLALPISLYLGVLIAFNRLSQDGELDAFHSAGIGLERLARPAVYIALLTMLVAAALFSHLKPYGRYAYQSMIAVLTNETVQAFLRARVFTAVEGMTFLIEGLDRDGMSFSKVFVFEQKEDGNQVVMTARGGRVEKIDGATGPSLRLYDGLRLELPAHAATATEAEVKPPASMAVLRFDELRTGLGLDGARLYRPRGKDEREFTLFELWDRRVDPPPDVGTSDMLAEFHGRVVRILSVPLLPFLAIPLALGRRRSDRSSGIVVGLLVLLIYHNVLDRLENMAESELVDPVIALWTPFLVFAAGTLVLFRQSATRVPGALSIGSVGDAVARVRDLVTRRPAREKEGA
ncbi:MAG: LPS export ABC transporter permease LptF [Rhodospirillales bacterium]